MTTIGGVGGGLLSRLFELVDGNRDDKVTRVEMSDLLDTIDQQGSSDEIMAAHDADQDGALSRDEWPTQLLSADSMTALLDAQEWASEDTESLAEQMQRAKEAFFARVDVDGNGELSREEVDADRVLNQARYLDTGAVPDALAFFRPGTDLNAVKQEDVSMGFQLDLSSLPLIKSDDAVGLQLERIRFAQAGRNDVGGGADDAPEVPVRPVTEEELGQKVGAAEFTNALLSRLMAQFSTNKHTDDGRVAQVDRSA